jgi:hypothetical protein
MSHLLDSLAKNPARVDLESDYSQLRAIDAIAQTALACLPLPPEPISDCAQQLLPTIRPVNHNRRPQLCIGIDSFER